MYEHTERSLVVAKDKRAIVLISWKYKLIFGSSGVNHRILWFNGREQDNICTLLMFVSRALRKLTFF